MSARLVAGALLAAAHAAAQRTVVSLDLGWRAALDTGAPGMCGVAYNLSLAGQRCMGLSSLSATDATSCQAAACAAYMQAWQWLASQGCWAGLANNCGPSGDAWVGGASPAIPGPPAPPADAPPAQPGFDDSGWEVVDIPHDATVTAAYSPTANGGEGFLPEAKSWYRKHFVAPTAWSGRAVWLVVDAALSTTTWWLNGKQLAVQNPAGYLPTVLRLDGAAGLLVNDSSRNLLAAFCDGTMTTGWWCVRAGARRGRASRCCCPSCAWPTPSRAAHPPARSFAAGMKAAASSALRACSSRAPAPWLRPLASRLRASSRAPSTPTATARPRRASLPTLSI
jgi:hypothetical protein